MERLKIDYPEGSDVITINGIKYASALFADLGGILPAGCLFSIVKRQDGTLTLRKQPEEAAPPLIDVTRFEDRQPRVIREGLSSEDDGTFYGAPPRPQRSPPVPPPERLVCPACGPLPASGKHRSWICRMLVAVHGEPK